MMKPNSIAIFNYVKAHNGENITSGDIAEGTGLAKRSVDGSVTAFQRKGLMARTEGVIETEDGEKTVKFISLTSDGMAFDPSAAE